MATAHSGRRRHHGSLVKLGNIDQAIGQRKVALDGHELVAHVHELLVTLCQQQDNGGSIGVDVLLARRLERRMHSGFAVEDDLVRRIVGNMLGKLATDLHRVLVSWILVGKDHQVGIRCGLARKLLAALLRLAAGSAKQRNDGASGKRALDRREKRTERKLVVRVVDDDGDVLESRLDCHTLLPFLFLA